MLVKSGGSLMPNSRFTVSGPATQWQSYGMGLAGAAMRSDGSITTAPIEQTRNVPRFPRGSRVWLSDVPCMVLFCEGDGIYLAPDYTGKCYCFSLEQVRDLCVYDPGGYPCL